MSLAADVEKQKWAVYKDPYTHLQRLDLYGFDGTPMNPMFQAYKPPQMLPTTTLNPTATAAAPAATAKVKRWLGLGDDLDTATTQPLNKDAIHITRWEQMPIWTKIEKGHLFWTALIMMVVGLILRALAKL